MLTHVRKLTTSPTFLLVIGVLTVSGLMLPAAHADSDDVAQAQAREQRAKLVKLKETITTLQGTLKRDRSKHGKLQAQLRHAEKAIGGLIRQIDIIDRKLTQQKKRMQGLQGERQTLWTDLARQRRVLAGQIRSAYAMGRQEYMKLLLNQQDPSVMGRTLVYYDYLNRARTARIRAIDESVTRLERIEVDITEQTARLERTRQEQLQQKLKLEKSRSERAGVLARLDKQIQGREEKLQLYQADAKQLEHLMEGLREALADVPANAGERKPFKSRRGDMRLPVKGRITGSFGAQRRAGGPRWQGVMIRAARGTEVQTVSHGRVAFADWLRGFGLMVIVDHGDGYMSLYGHNDSLFVETGDWVENGEVVATVGNSGGQKHAGLYFEIRADGKPTNPLRWCKR
ncbi:murein hydrolase activator EnvC family protein [Sulfuriflexus sp.]|uniref:murein hydrolase activator EnvC family protein n=1 Tax=Sulfuriflexus sp. TaxID=2015443 RepID=UPI0028CD6F32|nr:peptidoglycan DD-metalloendopeptidase family protein [Sulfuriflexus sp.]MDT8404426.1 peptidoglycan DD-metalloendopeptidase family protein [Sulfuriflexus sp.]